LLRKTILPSLYKIAGRERVLKYAKELKIEKIRHLIGIYEKFKLTQKDEC